MPHDYERELTPEEIAAWDKFIEAMDPIDSKKENTKEYICEACGIKFTPNWTMDEAVEEMKRKFPGHRPEDCMMVCDKCYDKVLIWKLLEGF